MDKKLHEFENFSQKTIFHRGYLKGSFAHRFECIPRCALWRSQELKLRLEPEFHSSLENVEFADKPTQEVGIASNSLRLD